MLTKCIHRTQSIHIYVVSDACIMCTKSRQSNYSPMPDKFKIKMDDQNRLHIWINRHTIKYQEWDSNLVATIPLHTSSEMKYLSLESRSALLSSFPLHTPQKKNIFSCLN
eukprot:832942_1